MVCPFFIPASSGDMPGGNILVLGVLMSTSMAVNFISYTHSGSGYLSLSFKYSTPKDRIVGPLKDIESAVDRSMLALDLEGVRFRGVVKSVISRKTNISFTVHMNPDKFTAMKIYDLVGKSGLSLSVQAANTLPTGHKAYLSREEYASLKTAVEEKLKMVAQSIGEMAEAILSRETAYKGKAGVRTFQGMSPARLEYLNRRFDSLLKEHSRGAGQCI